MKRMMKIGLVSLLLALLCVMPVCAAEGTPVADMAGLFAEDETAALVEGIAAFQQHTGIDAVIVTTTDKEGYSAEAYADLFYEQGGYGKGSARSGFLYLIDMEEREVYISTAGGAIELLSDSNIEKLLNEAYHSLSDAEYAGSAEAVLHLASDYYDQAMKKGWSYDAESGSWTAPVKKRALTPLKLLVSALLSALAGLTAVGNVKRKYAMKDSVAQASASAAGLLAITGAAFSFHTQADELLHRSTERRLLPSGGASGRGGNGSGPFGPSTTHMSSGGMRHGGGGRKF